MSEHASVGEYEIIATPGATEAREHDVLIGIKIDPETGRDARVEFLVGETFIELHATPAAAAPYSVSPWSPIR